MSPKKILVVEDNPNDREVYGEALYYNGFDVAFAEDGVSGLRLVEEGQPDLVILDLALPALSGLAFCTFVRRKLNLAVPIVVITAFSATEVEADAREAGCTSFFQKPVLPLELLREVERLIGRADER